MNKTDFYDENQNYLFVKKSNNGELLDHIFIHLDETKDTNFLAHFKSYIDDSPIYFYKLEKVNLSQKDNKKNADLFSIKNYTEEQVWKRIRVKAALPSPWKNLFELYEETQNQ